MPGKTIGRNCSWLKSLLVVFCVGPSCLPNVVQAQGPPEPKAELAPLREQTVYIPYEKLRQTFEKEGRGVFLPYEQFRELWDAARRPQEPPPVAPPVKTLIASIESEAVAREGVVEVDAVLSIDVLESGWHEIPLRLADAAIESATIEGRPARLLNQQDGYRLLIEKKDERPERLELKLRYAKGYTKSPGQNRFEVQAPQAAVNRWRIRIPDPGVQVDIHPLLAASEISAPPKEIEEGAPPQPQDPAEPPKQQDAAETVVLAFVGAAPSVRIQWTPKAEGAAGLQALATVSAVQQVVLDEGVLRTTFRADYEISRSELNQLVLEVPADQKVTGLFDPNVRQWKIEQDGPAQRVVVDLFQPARSRQSITFELEQFLEVADERELPIRMVRAVGVARQKGIVVVRLSEGLRGQATERSGLLQLDAADIPRDVAQRGNWPFAYRYATLPAALSLSVAKVQPKVRVDQLSEAYLEPEKLTVDTLAVLNIERAGLFELTFDLPADLEVRRVEGRAAAGASAVAIDSHRVEMVGDDRRLVISLGRKATGRVAVWIELERRLQQPDLLSPTGNAAALAVGAALVHPESVQQVRGRLVVYAPESLRVVPQATPGLRDVSLEEALAGGMSSRGKRFAGLRPVLAFAYSGQAGLLQIAAERRKPHITARQLLVASVEPGAVKYRARFFYDLRYSGTESVRIDLPESVAAVARNTTGGIRDQVIDPPAEGLDEGYVAWQFTGEGELGGSFTIELEWEQPLEELDVGASVKLDVPRLLPQGTDRAWGQILLAKAEAIDLAPAEVPTGLQPIDPQQDLMPGASVPEAAIAFEFHNPWSLKLEATRYELQSVKTTSIERGLVRMVVTRSDQISVQAIYRLRSARQRIELRLPMDVGPEGIAFDTQPLRIDGRPVALEQGADDRTFFVPLVNRDSDQAMVLELRYTQPGDASLLQVPEFPEEPAVQKVYLAAYLPSERAYLGARGPWTKEDSSRTVAVQRLPGSPPEQLLHQVYRELLPDADSYGSFSIDGELHLFSALRPEPGKAGALRLTTVDEDWLAGGVIAAVAAAGLLLLRQGARTRLAALAALPVGLMLLGIFAPALSDQILSSGLTAAVAVVVLVWFLKWLVLDRGGFSLPGPSGGAPLFAEIPTAEPGEVEQSQDEQAHGDKTEGGAQGE